MKKVDFLAHLDLFWGPMAEMSDIVLPVAHWLETDDIYYMHPRWFIEAHTKCVEPPGETKADVWIFREGIRVRLGHKGTSQFISLRLLAPARSWLPVNTV